MNELADKILPATTSIFGRKSKPGSHRLYRVAGKVPTVKFVDPVTGKMIHEIRGDGSQTVFPGSTHPSGELIDWILDGEPAPIDLKELIRAGARLAAHVLGQRYCNGVVAGDDASLRRALDDVANPAIVERILFWLDDPLATATASSSPSRRTNPSNEFATMDLRPLPLHLQGLETRPLNLEHFNRKFRAEPILAGCAQMHRLRDYAANQGRDGWWHSLGLLAFCENGDAIAHQLSSKHSKYTFEETQRELDGWRRKADGATLCETFERKSPGVCGKCPHWGKIKSPVSLGIDAQEVAPIENLPQPGLGGELNTLVMNDQPRGFSQQNRTAQKTNELSQRERLMFIGVDQAELWHDTDGNAFATINTQGHCETFSIKTSAFKSWLTSEFGARHPVTIAGRICPSAPSNQALTEALNALGAIAARGSEHQAAIRVAEGGSAIYVDLGTPDLSAVEVSADGWRIVQASPIRFLRPNGFRALPVLKGGNIRELSRFVNARADDFLLIVAWLLSAYRPTGPYPILVVNGEHGAGKSFLTRLLRRLVDPSGAELRGAPRNERDLLLAAKNGWIVALDNLSYVRNDLSDEICRIATKGAFATRSLYTNDEEFLLEVCRPVLLNGIPPLASRADLADRSIVLTLPTMPDSQRQSEQAFWSDFGEAAPRLLGALLDGVSGALRDSSSVDLRRSPRMIDFAKFAEAGCRALGIRPGAFEEVYAQNRASSSADATDADPVALSILALMSSKTEFLGTSTKLLSTLTAHASPDERDRRWPKDATRLSSHLRRLPPLLRQRGIEIDFSQRSNDIHRKRIISIKKKEVE